MGKRNFKKFYGIAGFVLLTASLVGCGKEKNMNKVEDNKIVIGVNPTPQEQIIENLLPKFKEAGLEVEIKVFDDYVQPNIALNAGDLDANYFQHKPYLDSFNQDHGFDNISIGGVHLEPLGVYSTKIKNFDEFKDGDEILIPNDPSNGARALILLEKNGLIKLKDSTDLKSTELDIVENKKNIKFTALDAATIAKSYKDVAGAVINSNFALGAGIDVNTALVKEDGNDNPYANLVVIKKENKNKEKFSKLMKIIQSKDTKDFIEKEFKGVIIPAFTTAE